MRWPLTSDHWPFTITSGDFTQGKMTLDLWPLTFDHWPLTITSGDFTQGKITFDPWPLTDIELPTLTTLTSVGLHTRQDEMTSDHWPLTITSVDFTQGKMTSVGLHTRQDEMTSDHWPLTMTSGDFTQGKMTLDLWPLTFERYRIAYCDNPNLRWRYTRQDDPWSQEDVCQRSPPNAFCVTHWQYESWRQTQRSSENMHCSKGTMQCILI